MISTRAEGGMLTLRVINDCPHFQSDDSNGVRRHGVGIANTKARLEQLYGTDQRMEIGQPEPGRFEVTLVIPMWNEKVMHEDREEVVLR